MWHYFFPRNPYGDLDASEFPDDLRGWNSDDKIFSQLIDLVRPNLIVEVGTWKGRSAVRMAQHCRSRGLPTQLLCVDTWLGFVDSYTCRSQSRDAGTSLYFVHGWPQVYYQFLANVVRRGLCDCITPLPQTSRNAVQILATLELFPDLVYIDGSHDYLDARRDIEDYFGLLRPEGGVLFGDDYGVFAGVTKAVQAASRSLGIPYYVVRGKYLFLKSDDSEIARRVAELLGATRAQVQGE